MKKKYDFSKGIKGKFYIPENEIEMPIYLNKENLDYFLNLSALKKIEMSQLVNNVLSKDRELIETMK